ncbi:MAG: DegT/DnrJ/EryC1/StrS family aminotransferase [Desulfobacteraceae bacterium]|nr:DegT/DnrJ/EryC1/StrS family aminotransferase [Desulfobacteraceae bacterium]
MIKLANPNIPAPALEKVIEVLKSGNLVQGEYVKKFEEALRAYHGVRNAIAVSSGTAALHLALLVLKIKQGDEVIIPAFTFPATANVVELVGATPIFVDISLDDFCINTLKIEKKINSKTKAIIPVHEFGQAARMDDIKKIAENYDLKIIEDAACALGAEFRNEKVGTFGDLACFSFHPRKAITTGEGGLVITDNDELADKIRSFRNHGIQSIDGKIDFGFPGLNYRMTDFQAALGLPQLKNIEDNINKRTNIANEYNQELADIEWINTPKGLSNRKMEYQTYHVLVKTKIDRDSLLVYLRKNDIEANYGAQGLNCINFYKKKYKLTIDSAPNASNAFYKGVALPIGNHITNIDIFKIVSTLKKYWER